MDNEKFQEFMADQFAKMFNVVQDFKKDVTTEFAGVKSEIGTIKTDLSKVNQSQTRMETELGKKLDILYYDWREIQKQFNEEVKTELKILGTKVEALQMESTKHDLEIKNLYLVKASKE
ncbi:MAG: hypothetical protein QMC95_02865 [Desulfitobacteriaceae bacterium]|nr:hypothetical protein [Desulfitobacteriaceae bacterium]MDI6913145.1 hypothetical protein [Desulfitobacteriaceae bacterium]